MTPAIELAMGIGVGVDAGKVDENTRDVNGERADEEKGQGVIWALGRRLEARESQRGRT